MPARLKILAALLIGFFLPLTAPAYDPPMETAPRAFDFDTDSFSFANETVWNYANGTIQADSGPKRQYTRHCFVLSRAAMQFWKFARFDPHGKPLPPDQLADRVREVTERSAWLPAFSKNERVVFPGYSNLREISRAYPGVFQANIGLGWPIYFRAGNMPIVFPVWREIESNLNDEIWADLQKNTPTIVWLYNFPSLSINHTVLIFSGHRDKHQYVYQVYDPNYAKGPKTLTYDIATRTFSYQPTFYFKGGPVDARAVYRGVLQ